MCQIIFVGYMPSADKAMFAAYDIQLEQTKYLQTQFGNLNTSCLH